MDPLSDPLQVLKGVPRDPLIYRGPLIYIGGPLYIGAPLIYRGPLIYIYRGPPYI